MQQRCNEAIHRIEAEADAAFRKVETVARQHLRQRQFAQARAALQPALATYGPVPAAGRARKLMEEIDQAERQAASQAEKPAETPKPPETPAISPELLKQRQLDATFAKAMAAVESRVAGWDFQGAVQESEKVRFDSPELTARLAARREQIRRMADLKDRMIATINQADPPLKKTDLALRGINGEVNKADAEAITATLPNGKQESLAWPELGPKAMNKLLQLVVRREDAGDWLAAGLLSLDGPGCPRAPSGISTRRGRWAPRPLPTWPCWRRGILPRSETCWTSTSTRKARRSWPRWKRSTESSPGSPRTNPNWTPPRRRPSGACARRRPKAVYAQAAGLFRNGDLYELKPVVERLKTQYADSAVAADPQRKPSLAELEKAVADLGPLVRVRKDGKGDAKTIQEAVNNAAAQCHDPNRGGRAVDRADRGSRREGGTDDLRQEGPLARHYHGRRQNSYSETLVVQSPQLSLERLVIVRADAGGPPGTAITADKTALSFAGWSCTGTSTRASSIRSRACARPASVSRKESSPRTASSSGTSASKASCSLENVLVCGGGTELRPGLAVAALHDHGASALVRHVGHGVRLHRFHDRCPQRRP